MSRPAAIGVCVGFAILLLLVLARFTVAAPEPPAIVAIRQEFGTGPLAGCFTHIAWRETGGTYNVRAANLTDANGGSYGMLQINAVWRRPGESVGAFAARMYDPAANARLAHLIYRRYGIGPWRSC